VSSYPRAITGDFASMFAPANTQPKSPVHTAPCTSGGSFPAAPTITGSIHCAAQLLPHPLRARYHFHRQRHHNKQPENGRRSRIYDNQDSKAAHAQGAASATRDTGHRTGQHRAGQQAIPALPAGGADPGRLPQVRKHAPGEDRQHNPASIARHSAGPRI